MRLTKSHLLALAIAVLLAGASSDWVSVAEAQALPAVADAADDDADQPDNDLCLGCHGMEDMSAPEDDTADEPVRDLYVSPDKFQRSVHAKRFCVECHKDIVEIPHREGIDRKVGCVQCHRSLWDTARKENKTEEFPRLAVVVQQIESYMGSIHAQPSMEDQSRTNATCYNCHNAHYIFPIDSKVGSWSRLEIPNICGTCHSEQKETYLTSVHGKEVSEKANPFAAVCIDCHTTHDIVSPKADSMKLVITRNCGNCHDEQLETYMGTYHGQVSTLGFAYTAKCFDCHGSHEIKKVDDEASTMHKNNRLGTCQKCHEGATEGYVTFQPHGNTSDFDRYPFMWIASKSMIALLSGVFAFFWTHMTLWFYREHKDRAEGKSRLFVQTGKITPSEGKYVSRWSPLWRFAHLIFALAVMTLVLTGTAVLYAETAWAKTIMYLIGGPEVAAIVHRAAAIAFGIVFFGHLIYFAIHIAWNWRTFRFFGPTSLVPNWQDLRDLWAMILWFFGRGPRPHFDRWTYWEKFDYWAPFWGMAIIGVSGAMMWFPATTASILPGWVFNVATIVHGEEAFLAAVFLFTVHFFNVHFRPDKFPMDIVIFTGALPLEVYKHEHSLEYERLAASGELEAYLVDAPSRPMTFFSKMLGATLILIGLTLLTLVMIGFWDHMMPG